ncbi:MAG: FkbM family methyltransferase [Bryobacteraceae bacterium]
MELFTHETQTLRRLEAEGYQPRVIYDIGASNGVWSDTIALTVPDAEYHLFEPLAEAVPFYRRDLLERMARRPNFRLHAVGLADHGGTAEMFATHDGFGSSILDRGAIPEVKERVSVPLYRLDEFVEQQSLPSPNVIKLDVQGAERLILSGGSHTVRNADVLFMETWLTRGYGPETPLLTEMIEFLEDAGFTLVELGEQFRHEHGAVYSVDAVFYSAALLPKS